MSFTDSSLLVMGLKGSGKTTYLAALWHYLEASEIKGRLSLPQLQPDRDYLNRIRTSWLAVKPVGRTSMRTKATVEMTVRDSVTAEDIKITLPDLSGETFRLQWATRKAPKDYMEYAHGCSGAFLFIHPLEVKKTHALASGSDESWRKAEPATSQIEPAARWTPTQTATAVQLVDILQLLLDERAPTGKLKLAVIISAWDQIKATTPPSAWLERRMPLLAQYLRGNRDSIVSQVFGISAQGGDLTVDHEKLLDISLASERCFVMEGESFDRKSIAAPLEFLISH